MIRKIINKFIKKAHFTAITNSTINSLSKVEAGTSFFHSSMGRHSFCGYDCDIFHAEIGSFTSIASNVTIGGAKHPMEWVGMSPVFYKGRDSIRKKFVLNELSPPQKTIIGNDVWIGKSAIIISGVEISNGAVIGAGSVVTKNIPPYAIAAGNPAKIIRYRFDRKTIEHLESIEWWNLKDNEIQKIAQHIKDPDKFISALQK